MSRYFIGIMSGTSLDGIDIVLADCAPNIPTIVATHYHPYGEETHQALLRLQTMPSFDVLAKLDNALADLMAEQTLACLKEAEVDPADVVAIGCHGQTVCHQPILGHSLQLANAHRIAAKTGIKTVSDFRRADMAYGGQGAPLTPAFHRLAFAKSGHARVIVNIGGIANITLIKADGSVAGFDSGPGNMLLDAWWRQSHGVGFDIDGAYAQSGRVQEALLDALLSESYFQEQPPKSTGRECFNLAWLVKILAQFKEGFAKEDVQATLVALTVRSIKDAIDMLTDEPVPIMVCGGGALNGYLMQCLQTACKGQEVVTSTALGIPPGWVEALAFAWFAKQCIDEQPLPLHDITGASRDVVAGVIYNPNYR